MDSFYGGQSGKSFEIKTIFANKKEMLADLNLRWQSPIGVSDYVVISYGLPGSAEDKFADNKEQDLNEFGRTYNSTLWQKIYTERKNSETDPLSGIETLYIAGDQGLGYRLIASMTGNTPQFSVYAKTIHSYENPRWTLDNSSVDKPELTLYLPMAQVVSFEEKSEITAKDSPYLEWDIATNGNTYNQYDSNGNAIPDGKDRPILRIGLPPAWKWKINYTTSNADQKPAAQLINDENTQILELSLPQAQIMDNPETNTIAPAQNPSVALSGTINNPKLVFDLPRAVKFYYGELLGEKTAIDYTLSIPEIQDYKIGDYYINTNTGFIYLVTRKESNNITFTYIACLQAPAPEINSIAINPYSENGKKKIDPSVFSSFTNDIEKTGLVLNFNLPKLPNFSATHEFLGSAEEGSISVAPNANDNINFHMKLPSASRIFAGDMITEEGSYAISDSILGNALFGDLYLNTKTGIVYKLDTDEIWHYQSQGLKGPPGSALNITRSYTITVSETMTDSLENGVQYIIDNYIDDKGNPLPYSSDKIFAITWIDGDNRVSYWYFYTEDEQWSRVQLVGEIGTIVDSIENSYLESVEPNLVIDRVYSIDYINKLVGGNISQNFNTTTLSKNQIYALLSWSTFEEAKNGSWWPGPGNII